MKRRKSTRDLVCTEGGSVMPFNDSFILRHAMKAKCPSYSMHIFNIPAKGWSLEKLAYNFETALPPLRFWKAERPGCNLLNISQLKVQETVNTFSTFSELWLIILYSQRIGQVSLGTKLFTKFQSLDTTKVSFSLKMFVRVHHLGAVQFGTWGFSSQGSKGRNRRIRKGFVTVSVKSPTYEPSSCELSKIRTCVSMSNHLSQFTFLEYTATCMQPLQVVVLLCTLQYCIEYNSIVSLFQARSARGWLHWTPCVQHEELTNEDLMESETHRKDEERQKK